MRDRNKYRICHSRKKYNATREGKGEDSAQDIRRRRSIPMQAGWEGGGIFEAEAPDGLIAKGQFPPFFRTGGRWSELCRNRRLAALFRKRVGGCDGKRRKEEGKKGNAETHNPIKGCILFEQPQKSNNVWFGFGFITGSCKTIRLKVQVRTYMHTSFPWLTAWTAVLTPCWDFSTCSWKMKEPTQMMPSWLWHCS